jgi:alpha-galactosidase
MKTTTDIECGDMVLRYVRDDALQSAGMTLIPSARLGDVVPHEDNLCARSVEAANVAVNKSPIPAAVIDPMVHLKVMGEAYPGGFSQGRTMRGAGALREAGQHVHTDSKGKVVRTFFSHKSGLAATHEVQWLAGAPYCTIRTTVVNEGPGPVTLEALTSFSLDGISPFDPADAAERLWLHRFRSGWSAEGRLESMPVELAGLDRAWIGASAFCERFGQIGTMPVRGFFPRVLVEDRVAGVFWGAQVCWAGSWQLEVFRQHDHLCLSGGLADREFGHWTKTLQPGESLTTPMAALTVASGSLDDTCDRLNAQMIPATEQQPAVEKDLPIVFNDYCTSWGSPNHDEIVMLANRLQGTPVKYLVIDAGWYGAPGQWARAHGDWEVYAPSFPQGLRATTDAVRARGLIPGLWFEAEVVGGGAKAAAESDHLLQRDGHPIVVAGRRFWNLRDPWVQDYLHKRVIQQLKECGFGYLKLDYNETVGFGCDGEESPGEGLRRHVEEGIYPWFDRLRAELPDLVIENCASGGHRHEPSILGRCAMTSFSDAHESSDIPIIAGNLRRLLLARQMQLWAVLRTGDSNRRLVYSLAATFLGRMCLSGDLHKLSEEQWALVREAMDLYRETWPIIKHGQARRFGPPVLNYHHPKGWQVVLARHDSQILGVVHCFGEPQPETVDLELPWAGTWNVVKTLVAPEDDPRFNIVSGTRVQFRPETFLGAVFLLQEGTY